LCKEEKKEKSALSYGLWISEKITSAAISSTDFSFLFQVVLFFVQPQIGMMIDACILCPSIFLVEFFMYQFRYYHVW